MTIAANKKMVYRAAARIFAGMEADGVTRFAHLDTVSGEKVPCALIVAVTEDEAAEVHRLLKPWLDKRFAARSPTPSPRPTPQAKEE